MATKDERMTKTARDIMDHAERNYEKGGWDYIVECFSVNDLVQHMHYSGATTAKEMWKTARAMVGHYSEQLADAQNSAF